MKNTVIYEEKAPQSKFIKALLGSVLLFLVFVLLSSVLRGSEDKTGFKIVVVVTIVIAYAYWSFFNMRFRITTEGVEASMPPFSYSVRYPEIEDVYVENVPWWAGWGLRMWWRRIAFLSRHGKAVMIRKQGGVFSGFWLSAKDPEGFANMIRGEIKTK